MDKDKEIIRIYELAIGEISDQYLPAAQCRKILAEAIKDVAKVREPIFKHRLTVRGSYGIPIESFECSTFTNAVSELGVRLQTILPEKGEVTLTYSKVEQK